jgi:hypothetical protein|tara:strand:+ start:371 stop:499 length:129 start_codon:yes stop_codon:yes gene_type:complete
MKENREYYSRIYDKKYSKKDLFFDISEEEQKRLDELGFYLEE